MSLAVVKDLRSIRRYLTPDEIAAAETDMMSGFVLARSSAGLADSSIRIDVRNLELIRDWFERPLWEMEPADADRYFGSHIRKIAKQTRSGRAASLSIYFYYLEKRHSEEIYNIAGHAPECPLDDLNRPRGGQETMIRIPPPENVLTGLFDAWRTDLSSTRKFSTEARDYLAARLMSKVGLRIFETSMLDLDDIHAAVGSNRYSLLHVRFAKGSRGSGHRTRIIPLINGADPLLEWYVQEVRGGFEPPKFWDRPGAPLFCSERFCADGSAKRVTVASLRKGLNDAVLRYAPAWHGRITPHVLRHYCASELYRTGMDLIAIQELLGHEWISTTMRYVHVLRGHVEDAWTKASARTLARLTGGNA